MLIIFLVKGFFSTEIGIFGHSVILSAHVSVFLPQINILLELYKLAISFI